MTGYEARAVARKIHPSAVIASGVSDGWCFFFVGHECVGSGETWYAAAVDIYRRAGKPLPDGVRP